jgi:hypothetical protein
MTDAGSGEYSTYMLLGRMTRWVLVFVFVSTALTRAGQYNDHLFRQALSNDSTAPDYVLITAMDSTTHTRRTICTTANALLGALHREYSIGYDAVGQKRIKEIALRQSNRVFSFKKRDAAENLVDHSTSEALAEVRRLFAAKTDGELFDQKLIDSLTVFRRDLPYEQAEARHTAYRDAVARALLQRGVGCTMGCVTDNLTPHKMRPTNSRGQSSGLPR